MAFQARPGFHADAREPSKPGSTQLAWSQVPWLFVIIVVIPTLLTSFYYLFLAAPLYVSEARFVVRARGQGQTTSLGSLLQTVGVLGAPSQTDAYEVQEYMTSRDAVVDLVRAHDLRARLARPESDFLARFPRPFEDSTIESLFKNYKRFVTVGLDSQTGMSVLRVTVFRASDAREIANDLLNDGEQVVNRLNQRAMADAVSQAELQVRTSEARTLTAQSLLTEFRNREQLIDPDKSSIADINLLASLQLQLANLRARRDGLAAVAPEDPQLHVLDSQIAAYSARLEAERLRTAGEANSLAPKVGEYEQLLLERDIAVKSLEAAEASLENARLDARRQQLFLERVVNPDLPDKAEQPKRLLSIFKVLVSCLVAYGTITLIIAGVREHQHR